MRMEMKVLEMCHRDGDVEMADGGDTEDGAVLLMMIDNHNSRIALRASKQKPIAPPHPLYSLPSLSLQCCGTIL